MNTENENYKNAKQLAEQMNGAESAQSAQQDFKLITLTIQDVNPVSFSEQCEKLLKTINPEVLSFYGVNTQVMNTNRGQALVFVGIVQYWGDTHEHSEWLTELKRNNLLIKP